MLGNIVPLWEIMLAAMKLGAVVIPASTLLQPADLADRVLRGNVRHVIAEVGQLSKFAEVPGDWTPRRRPAHAVRLVLLRRAHRRSRLAPLRGIADRAGRVRAGRAHPRERPAAALLHLGDDLAAEAGRPHPRQLPGRPPVHHVLDRHQARRRAPQHLLARLGEARLVEPVRPVERAGHDPHTQPAAVQRRRGCSRRSATAASARSARRRPCGGCSSRPTCPRPTPARCASASRRASRSTPRSSTRSARPGASPCGTASARRRRPRRSATRPASRSSPARWAARCPATRSSSSTR